MQQSNFVNYFRPISLLNSVLKLLTKIMSGWLQRVIIPLVHQNQYGFIKNRTIQDCLAWAFEYIHQRQYSKNEIIILKPDFEKAFDTIDHNTILCMLHHLGFTSTWCSWVKRILDTGTAGSWTQELLEKNFNSIAPFVGVVHL